MKRIVHQAHVWLGLAAGFVLLLLCLSGSLSVFRVEIGQWAAGGAPAADAACALDADAALAVLRARLDPKAAIRRLSLPELTGGHLELRMDNGKRAQADVCGQAVHGARVQVADFLVNLHTRLFMAKPGRWIVGVLGALMLLSVMTGLLAHRKLLTQWFTLRRGRSTRLALSDGHKLLGLWLLPFHVLTAGTGAWLGLSTLLPAPEAKGVQAVARAPYERPSGLQAMLVEARGKLAGLEPVFIDFFPERGQVSVRGNLPGHLVQRYSAEVLFDGHTGALLGVHDPRTLEGGAWWRQAMMPLHLGDWAGVSLRGVYAVLGLGSAALVWIGLWLWADRRRNVAGLAMRRGKGAMRLLHSMTGALSLACVVPWLAWRLSQQAFAVGPLAFGVTLVAGLLLFIAVGRRLRQPRSGLAAGS